jgi:rhodanese-related sulfurtransferase
MNQLYLSGHRKIMKCSVLLFILLMISSSMMASIFQDPQPKSVVKTINTTESAALIKKNLKNKNFVILDVRTPEEYADGHLANATNIDFKATDFAEKVGKLDKSKSYLVYCRSGHRSASAAEIMKTQSFQTIYNLDGGITQWTTDKNPVIK